MDKILYNLALIDTTKTCIAHDIDCSDSYLYKTPRKFIYTLYQNVEGRPIGKPLVSVEFHKSSVPTHIIYK